MSWLKIETITPEKPEVLAMAEELQIDPDAVFGKLFRIWAWFDFHTQDGCAPRVTPSYLDRNSGVTGFAQAMQNAGWLVAGSDGLTVPNFDRHNGQTAKTRALAAKRMEKKRCAPIVTSAQPEKRREEKNKEIASAISKRPKKFKKPTTEEIHDYATGLGKAIDPEAFWDFYEAKGWLVGRAPMKSWQAAVRNWAKNQSKFNPPEREVLAF